MALIAPSTDISPATFNEVMGASVRALARHYIPRGVRDYFEMARRSNYKKVRRIPVAMMKLDACLATVVEATCPPSAKQQLRTFLASHIGVTNDVPLGIQCLGCIFEVSLRHPRSATKQ